jgi:hypothetical protein
MGTMLQGRACSGCDFLHQNRSERGRVSCPSLRLTRITAQTKLIGGGLHVEASDCGIPMIVAQW